MTEVQSLSPTQAAEFVRNNPHALFADVRSSMEFLFVGHPIGAANIAWVDEPDWEINPHFAEDIARHAVAKAGETTVHDLPIVLICRSGVRSLEAGKVLLAAGFTQVYNVLEGFEGALDEHHHRGTRGGWRFHQLPWEQC